MAEYRAILRHYRCVVTQIRDAETTILIKFAFWRGLGRGKIYGKLPQNAVFPGKFHDNKIWKFCEFYCQKFCCHLGGSYQRFCYRGPKPQKYPKCKRCFGPREQRSPKSLLHHQNPVLHRCNSLLRQCKRTLAPLAQKSFCTLS